MENETQHTTPEVITTQPEVKARKKPGPKPKVPGAAKAPKVAAKKLEASESESGVAAPETPSRMAPTDQAYDFSGYHEQRDTATSNFPTRPGFDVSAFSLRWFRHDEMHKLDGGMQCGYWVPVTISGFCDGIPFTEMFPDTDDPTCPFDETGFLPYGGFITTPSGKRCRECYLAARPARARQAELKLRAELSEKKFNPKAFAGQAQNERIQSAGQAQGQAAVLNHQSANPSEPLTQTVPSEVTMGVNMITSGKWSGIKNT